MLSCSRGALPKLAVQLVQAGLRANLEKPRMREVGAQAALLGKVGLDAIEPPGTVRGDLEDDVTPQRSGPVVDVIQLRIPGAFLIPRHPETALFVGAHAGVALVPLSLVLVDRHH